jgi:transcriptional regulator with GAF, ATPase, and Fis domain
VDAVLEGARVRGYQEIVAHALGLSGMLRARTGEADAGLGLIAEAGERFGAMGFAEGVAEMDFEAAEVLLDRARPSDAPRAVDRLAHAREALPELGTLEPRARLLQGRVLLARGEARAAQKLFGEAIEQAEKASQWEVLAQALAARAQSHGAMGADIHARRDRERALEVLENTAAILPPDLRSAFWSVAARAALRAPAVERAGAGVDALPAGASNGASVSLLAGHMPTLVANDQRLVLLLELSRRVGEEQTLERVLEQAVRSAVELTNAERGAVLLLRADGGLSMRARSGPTPGGGPDEAFSRSIAETVMIDGEAVATHNARGDVRFADYRSVHDLSIGAVAAVPIRARGRTLGVLYVENRLRRTVWSPSDVALMRAFAEQAGLAVEHARLVEELSSRTRELEAAKREIEGLLQVRTVELEDTRQSLRRAEEALKSRFAPQGMVSQTEAMRKVFAVIDRVRDSDVPVVVEGESGTGKELVARAIHFSGVRAKGPFVVVHCGAIPETLLESELFGHVRGAFTGADRDRKGLIASAHGGTLMLDEVSEMPLRMQVELLRVLQDRKVRPVGSEKEEQVDVRVVAATNRTLRELVAEGRFREDLYYRLSVVTLRIPPLRARLDDIPALASFFLARFAEEHGQGRKRLTREATSRLLRAPWPGNVRQLRHTLESAAVLAEGDTIDVHQLGLEEPAPGPGPVPARSGAANSTPPPAGSPLALRKAAERQRIIDALEQVNWNKVRAATVLGMPRRTLYRRLREYGLLEE